MSKTPNPIDIKIHSRFQALKKKEVTAIISTITVTIFGGFSPPQPPPFPVLTSFPNAFLPYVPNFKI